MAASVEQPLAQASSTQLGQRPHAQASTPSLLDVSAALSRWSLSQLPDGGLRIDAPREVAALLAELFEGFAKSLRAISSRPELFPCTSFSLGTCLMDNRTANGDGSPPLDSPADGGM